MTSVKRSLKKRASLVLGSEDLVLVQILLGDFRRERRGQVCCVFSVRRDTGLGEFFTLGLWSPSGRSPGRGNGNPPLYSCLGNPMDRGAWQATVPGGHKELCCSFVILDKFNFFFLWPLLSFPYFSGGVPSPPLALASPSLASKNIINLISVLTIWRYGPAEAPVTNGSAVAGPALNDDLDIFGPMISNPLPATVMPPAQGTSSAPAAATLSAVTSGDLDLFTEQAAKSEEVAKKQLSKDSILSLYGAGAIQQQSAPGVFMGPTNLPFTSQAPAAFPGFPSMGVPVPAAPGLVGSSLGPSAGMMVGVPVPNGFMGSAQTAVMPLTQGVVGPPGMVPHMGAAQGKFGLQPAPQSPWNLPQVNQQMAGLSLGGVASAAGFGPPPSTSAGAAGWSGSSSGQTLSTQLWK
ncbi:hypothetical protein FD755_021660 [Muntiacus reevesi]|uniref:Stromal membrane-associated protein 1 n=1 Tax=Muntiacus reevesi TaxID=9886 RepID=A0A5N3W275_MUNRE|nr:hypothetical protein FD755_021660 [Muntiacus reevesi]